MITVDPFGPHHRKESLDLTVLDQEAPFELSSTFKALKPSGRPKETYSNATYSSFPSPKVEGMLFPVSSPVTLNTNQARLNGVKIQIYTQII